jgi:hypothetical protein
MSRKLPDQFFISPVILNSVFERIGPFTLTPKGLICPDGKFIRFEGLVATQAGSPSGTQGPLPQPQAVTVRIDRLEIDPLTRRVSLDRKSEIIKHATAFQIFLFVAEAKGALVTSEEIREKVFRCNGNVRIDTILRNHLPKWVRALIPGQPGPNGGYALRLPK